MSINFEVNRCYVISWVDTYVYGLNIINYSSSPICSRFRNFFAISTGTPKHSRQGYLHSTPLHTTLVLLNLLTVALVVPLHKSSQSPEFGDQHEIQEISRWHRGQTNDPENEVGMSSESSVVGGGNSSSMSSNDLPPGRLVSSSATTPPVLSYPLPPTHSNWQPH